MNFGDNTLRHWGGISPSLRQSCHSDEPKSSEGGSEVVGEEHSRGELCDLCAYKHYGCMLSELSGSREKPAEVGCD